VLLSHLTGLYACVHRSCHRQAAVLIALDVELVRVDVPGYKSICRHGQTIANYLRVVYRLVDVATRKAN
jgi:hypothetical protein